MSSKATSSTAAARGSVLMPELRFPEFLSQPVEALHLADATIESTERNGTGPTTSQIMGVSKVEGIVPMEERIVAADTARYKSVRKDWFAYNPMRINIGSIARWKGVNDILVSPDYVVFKCKSSGPHRLDPAYLDHFRRSDAWENFVSKKGDGSVRVRIYYKDLARLRIALPSFPEQQKIAECLDSADALIEAQGQKVEALKAHKKGLMQQLFPREGETQPRLRFPEFQNAGEWEDETLGTVCELYQPVTLSSSDLSMTGEHLVYGANGVIGTHNEYNHEDSEIAVTCRGATCGKVTITTPQSWITGNAMVVKPRTKKLRKDFIFQYFKNHGLKTVISGSAQPQITRTGLAPLVIFFPKPHEQERIATCLSSLDALITAETQKHEALKTHKKGLMQQLFPSPEEVGT